MRRLVQGLAYIALLGAVVLVPHAIAYAVIPEYVYGGLSISECATEDSTDCYWDATIRGNGEGNSFIVGPEGQGTAYYFGKGE